MSPTTLTATGARDVDRALSARAALVVPGGMHGHLNRSTFPPEYPQFFARGQGTRLWDVDGNALRRPDVRLGADGPRLPAPPRRRGLPGPAGPGRLPERAGAGVRRAGRAARRHGRPRRLGDVLEERHRRHHDVPHHRAGRHRPTQGAQGTVLLPRRRALVHARARRRDGGGPRQRHRVRVQRPRRRRARRGAGAGRRRRHHHHAVPPRHGLRGPGGRRPGRTRTGCGARDRLGAALVLDDVRCGFRYDVRRQLGAARRAARPERLQQGHRATATPSPP